MVKNALNIHWCNNKDLDGSVGSNYIFPSLKSFNIKIYQTNN